MNMRQFLIGLLLAALIFLLAACSRQDVPAPPQTQAATGLPALETLVPSPSAVPPSATPEPAAALVNGEAILAADFEAEIARYQDAHPETPLDDAARQRVLDSLVDTLLLAQGARAEGFQPGESELQSRLDDLIVKSGGAETFQRWLETNHFDDESFRRALALNAQAAWMRDRIAASLPGTLEQVRARQIFLYNAEDAKNVLERLNAGTDFVTLATEADPVAAGELGWFPRGYLLEPDIEAAAFALQPGEYSAVIETRLGFHIIQVIDRQADRPLDPDARYSLQQKAVQDWLVERRTQSVVEVIRP
jgi:peptidyl-prolyl cis-trans isomerase C